MDKPKTSLEGAFRVFDVPVTPVEIKVPDAIRELPNAGTGSMEGQYPSRVRDNQTIREATKPEDARPKTAQEQANDDQWQLLLSGWGRR